MTLEACLQGASLLQLTEALVSKSDQAYLQLARFPSHLRGTGFHTVGGKPLELQIIVQRGPKHSTSSCELTNLLWAATSRIASLINETRPLYRLPPEVLAEVFTWHQRLESTYRNKWFTWIRLTSVSCRWRSTILSFPSLWSVAYLSDKLSPEIIRMLLRRSGGHPLDVVVPLDDPEPGTKFNRYSHALDASAHTSRIRKFAFYSDEGRGGMKRIVRIFSKPAPNLTHLDLAVLLVKPISFPDLFGLEFPKLRVLEVTRVEGWPEVVGANLTHIIINASLNPWLLKECILYSSNLKVLELQGIWDFDKPDLSTWQRITLLPGVHLSIQHSQMCPQILALFALPRDGHIRVRPSMSSAPKEPLLFYVLPTEISHLQNLRMLTRLHMKARFDIRVALELKCFRLNRPAFEVDIGFSFESRTIVQQKASPVMWFLRNLHRIVLRGVEELRVDGFVGRLEPQEVELLTFLKRMPALTRVITTDGNEGTLRSVLDSLGSRAIVIRGE